MSLLSKIKATFQSLVRKQELDRDLDEELRSYLGLLTQEKIKKGMSLDEARREARLELGGAEQVKQRTREARAGAGIDRLLQDIQYAFRTLRKNIGFAAIAISILAIGIGATTALFSTINTVLLQQIPFEEPERLVMGRKTRDGALGGPVSKIDYLDYQKLGRSFEDLAAHGYITQQTISEGGRPELVRRGVVTWNLFQTLRVNPVVGRGFLPEEQELGAADVVLVSYGFWQTRFGGTAEAIGTNVNLDGSWYTVIGVMPRGFRFLEEADLWSPIERDGLLDAQRDSHSLTVVGRLKAGVSIEQAQSEMDAISEGLARQYPDTNKGKGLALTNLHAAMVGQIRPSLILLMATTALVLLIACGNVAGLLLARGQQRLPEMAMRSALGAPRRRLVRQLLTESVILTFVAGVVGVFVAYLLQDLLVQLLPVGDLGMNRPVIDEAALAFALLVSVLTGLVVGIAPALRGTDLNLSQQLKTGIRSSDEVHRTRLRSGLVVLQVAVSVTLLIGSGLLIRSLSQLTRVDLGFDPDHLLTGRIKILAADYSTPEERNLFFSSLLEEIEAQPNVVSATMTSKLPILDPWQDWPIWLADQPRPSMQDSFFGMARWIPPGYFETMRIPLLHGRDLSETDVPASPRVVVLSEAVVRNLFPEGDSIGRLVKIGWSDDPYQVVGVVADARLNRLRNDPDPALYMASAQVGANSLQVAVRTSGNPTLLIGTIQALLQRKDPNVIFANPATLNSVIDDALGDFRIVIFSLGLFSIVALVLTAIGLYGVIAYHVSQRTNELGIRLAMGASNATLLWMILKKGMVLVGIGLALGTVGAYSASLLIRQLLFETQPLDATAYAGAVGFLGLVALAACFLPAWRATRVNLVDVLRTE